MHKALVFHNVDDAIVMAIRLDAVKKNVSTKRIVCDLIRNYCPEYQSAVNELAKIKVEVSDQQTKSE